MARLPVHNHGPEEGKGLLCRESLVGGWLVGECMAESQSAVYWQRQWVIESEARSRATSQIREALAILDEGTEYEKLHLRGILEAGL